MRVRRRDQQLVEMQMGPMIDMVFLLLVFFMVTAKPIKQESDISLGLPGTVSAEEAVELPDEQRIRIEDDGSIEEFLKRVCAVVLTEDEELPPIMFSLAHTILVFLCNDAATARHLFKLFKGCTTPAGNKDLVKPLTKAVVRAILHPGCNAALLSADSGGEEEAEGREEDAKGGEEEAEGGEEEAFEEDEIFEG